MAKKLKRTDTNFEDIALRADTVVPWALAVALIAKRTRRADDSDKAAQDKAAKRIKYAIYTKGDLAGSSAQGFELGVLVAWARRKWPGKFYDLPAYVSGAATVRVSSSVKARGTVTAAMPSSVADCHTLLAEKMTVIADLREQICELRAKVDHDSRDAERWRALKSRNAENARKQRQK
jgi:hypothetical protein